MSEVLGGITTVLAEWDWVGVWGGTCIHHAARLEDPERFVDEVRGRGRTTCGRELDLVIPGLLARMGASRCKQCCRILDIPQGVGSPKNCPELRPWVEQRIEELRASAEHTE